MLFGVPRQCDPNQPILFSVEQLRLLRRRMTIAPMRCILLIATFLTFVALSDGAAATSRQSILVARVGLGDSYRIGLSFPDGRPVRRLAAGRYTIVVHDYSKIHNFALGSVTANKRLFTGSIIGTGIKRYTISLAPGSYAYACSAHPQTMHGSFTVT